MSDRRCMAGDHQWTGGPVCPECPPVPYYCEDGITIYLGDCRDVLPHLEPADHVITDPPYDARTHAGVAVERLRQGALFSEAVS